MDHATLVTTNRHRHGFTLPGKPSAQMVHEIAEAFIGEGRDYPLRGQLRRTFGRWNFTRYAIDYTCVDIHARLTFSRFTRPEGVTYRRGVIAIAPKHQAELEVYITDTEPTVFERAAFQRHPFFLE